MSSEQNASALPHWKSTSDHPCMKCQYPWPKHAVSLCNFQHHELLKAAQYSPTWVIFQTLTAICKKMHCSIMWEAGWGFLFQIIEKFKHSPSFLLPVHRWKQGRSFSKQINKVLTAGLSYPGTKRDAAIINKALQQNTATSTRPDTIICSSGGDTDFMGFRLLFFCYVAGAKGWIHNCLSLQEE